MSWVPPPGAKYPPKVFGILLHVRFVYSPPSVYLFNNLFNSHIYLKLCIINQSFILFFELFQLWPLEVALSVNSLCIPLIYLHQYIFGAVVLLFSYFLKLQDTPCLSCIFPAAVLESEISLRSPGSFYWRMATETKIWVLRVLCNTLFILCCLAKIC